MCQYRNKLDIVSNLSVLHQLHKLILTERTGGVERIRQILHLSHSGVLRRLDQLRDMGAEIEYDKSLNSYVYLNNFVFELTIKS